MSDVKAKPEDEPTDRKLIENGLYCEDKKCANVCAERWLMEELLAGLLQGPMLLPRK